MLHVLTDEVGFGAGASSPDGAWPTLLAKQLQRRLVLHSCPSVDDFKTAVDAIRALREDIQYHAIVILVGARYRAYAGTDKAARVYYKTTMRDALAGLNFYRVFWGTGIHLGLDASSTYPGAPLTNLSNETSIAYGQFTRDIIKGPSDSPDYPDYWWNGGPQITFVDTLAAWEPNNPTLGAYPDDIGHKAIANTFAFVVPIAGTNIWLPATYKFVPCRLVPWAQLPQDFC